jgi:hypothetical protein
LLFLCSALVVPGLNYFVVASLTLLMLLASFPYRRSETLRLLWRSRWLFLVILLGYAYSLPGEAAWPAVGDASPSLTGLQSGAMQATRLALMLLLLDAFVLSLDEARLLAGLHTLFRRVAWAGIDPERLTVRLALTIRLMKGRAGGNLRRDIVTAFNAEDIEAGAVSRIVLPLQSWRRRDSLALAAGMALVAWVWLRA